MLCTTCYLSHRNFMKFTAQTLSHSRKYVWFNRITTWSTNHITVWFALLRSFVASYSCEAPGCWSTTKYKNVHTDAKYKEISITGFFASTAGYIRKLLDSLNFFKTITTVNTERLFLDNAARTPHNLSPRALLTDNHRTVISPYPTCHVR